MIETAAYFAVLLVLYATECGVWIARTSRGLLRSPDRAQIVHASTRLGGADSGWMWASLPPWRATLHVLHPLPVRLAVHGFTALDAAPGDERLVPWDGLGGLLADGTRLMLGPREVARAANDAQARMLRRILLDVARAPASEREAVLQALHARRNDAQRVRERAAAFDVHTRWTSRLATTHFVFVHGVAPAVAIPLPFAQTWLPLLGAFSAIWLAGLIAFTRAHAQLFPERKAERQEALTRLLLMPLSPSRARDVLARDLFDDCDPECVIEVLACDGDVEGEDGRARASAA